ncbi:protein of unknown function [Nitrosotalea devaniterrae]|uniref:Uncharacterized protein n=1 Tax=Nitrosotalea devaniterrae TaxID=1078905 RepID=A0A128A0E5_9ARCH|nr:protein of unknown function [Candidatus Nitrosotalea devanaterra]
MKPSSLGSGKNLYEFYVIVGVCEKNKFYCFSHEQISKMIISEAIFSVSRNLVISSPTSLI